MRTLLAMAALKLAVACHSAWAGLASPDGIPAPERDSTFGLVQRPVIDGVEFVVGNELWQPGNHYRTGVRWLALSCTKTACIFEAAKLVVRRPKWQGHYDDEATVGQHLTFSKVKRSEGKVIGWFLLDAKHAWLKPGRVTTYASNAGRIKRPLTQGTLEVVVDLPGGTQAIFVPLLDQAQSLFRLQLRAQGRRQLLGQIGGCSGTVSTDYMLWAGDLDGDDRADYLVSFVDADGPTLLYLARAAVANEIAGVAGIYNAPPDGGECDGGGWIAQY